MKILQRKQFFPSYHSAYAVRRTLYAVLFLLTCFSFSLRLEAAVGEKAMVVTSDPRATQTALEILKQGGNAIDAAVAAQWVLNVVQPNASGIGGSGYLLFYDIGIQRILFFDGSVKAPEEAFPKMFLDKTGQLLPYQERSMGGLAVGVPGLLKLLEQVHGLYGTKKFSFGKLFDAAIEYAEKKTEVSASLANALQKNRDRLTLLGGDQGVFFDHREVLLQGQKLLQPDLAKTFRLIQAKGTEAFYKGKIAKAIIAAVQKNHFRNGFLSYRDLERYEIAKRNPAHGSYQDYDVFSAGPPSRGGVELLMALNVISHFGVSGLGRVAEAYHLLGETQKVAFSVNPLVADPDYFDIPTEAFLSEDWAKKRADTIKLDRVIPSEKKEKNFFEENRNPEKSSILIVDSQGNMVALSATLGDALGSGVLVPGYGFFLNNQLTDFDTRLETMDHPDAANVPAGGQRPQTQVAPTFIFQKGKPSFILNTSGELRPAAALLNLLVHKIDFNESCENAVKAPRILDREGALQMGPELYKDEVLRLKLALLGHKVEEDHALGGVQMICFDNESDKITGATDFGGSGEAEGF